MSHAKKTRDDARPQDGDFRNQLGERVVELRATKNWHWHDPPILFPICLALLMVAYVVLRTSQ